MKIRKINSELRVYIDELDQASISENRKVLFAPIVNYIAESVRLRKRARLNFICTHNSRRSQFAQVWAQTAADALDLPVDSYSGGTEVTACNPRTVEALERAGFKVDSSGEGNPVYRLHYSQKEHPILAFSKVHDDDFNPSEQFAAIMTCSDADENCPFIPGADIRIPLLYIDPKFSDDTSDEAEVYDDCCRQIASEMFFIFSMVKNESGL